MRIGIAAVVATLLPVRVAARVLAAYGSQTQSSPVWSFHTEDLVAVQPIGWSAVKQMFR